MSLARQITADLIQIERELAIAVDANEIALPQVFGWLPSGENDVVLEIPCSPGARNRGTVPTLGGFDVEFAFSLLVRLDLFVTFDSTLITMDDDELYTMDNAGAVPVSGKVIHFPGKEGTRYKIVRARVAALNTHVELFMADLNK